MEPYKTLQGQMHIITEKARWWKWK